MYIYMKSATNPLANIVDNIGFFKVTTSSLYYRTDIIIDFVTKVMPMWNRGGFGGESAIASRSAVYYYSAISTVTPSLL